MNELVYNGVQLPSTAVCDLRQATGDTMNGRPQEDYVEVRALIRVGTWHQKMH